VGVVSAPGLEVGYGWASMIGTGMVEERIDDRRAGATTEDSGNEQ
jgi:hypothetical protein